MKDREAWYAAVHGVAESQPQLSDSTATTVNPRQTHREQTCGYTKEKQTRERTNWEFGVSGRTTLHIGRINNKVLLFSTGNYIQYS